MPEKSSDLDQIKEYLAGFARRVFLTDTLEPRSLRHAGNSLLRLDFESNQPITLLLESAGGNVDKTLQFIDIINSLNSPVDVIGLGDCSSMAVDLILSCRKRMLLPSSRMLVHFVRHGREWIGDDPERLENDIEYFRQDMRATRERRLALYEKRTGMTREKILEMFRHGETHRGYFSAQQCISLGLADEIITDFKIFEGKLYDKK